jgi:hypothetical protein
MTAVRTSIYEKDFLIKDLPEPISELLNTSNLPWLNSPQFCLGYASEPAERVWLRLDDDKVHEVVFYRLIKQMTLSVIEIVGFPDCKDEVINNLIKKHSVKLAFVNRLDKSLQPDEKKPSLPPHVYFKNHVIFLDLPASKEEYLNSLGKNRKKQLPQYLRRVDKYFNSDIEIRIEMDKDIKIEDIIELEKLNSKRRAGKGKGVDSIDAIEKRQTERYALTQYEGFLLTFRHQGKILGGSLAYLHGDSAYMIVTAHENTLEHLHIGLLSMWKTMEYLMDNGYKTCCYLWGKNIYKTQFLGVEFPWYIHVISPNKGLSVLWKYQIGVSEFYIRSMRFLKTKMGMN